MTAQTQKTALNVPAGTIKMQNGIVRAPVIMVTGPGHMIGSRKQVEKALQTGRGELPPWYSEWNGLLGPAYHMEILESPYQVAQFFREAERNPHTPRVGFISNSALSLHSGYEAGTVDQHTAFARERDQLFKDHVEYEIKKLEERRKASRKKAQAEAEATDDDDDDGKRSIDLDVYGLTPPQYIEIDGHQYLDRQYISRSHYGLTCPTCGTVVRNKDKELTEADDRTLRKMGLATATCECCGEHLGQMSREQDNVNDRNVPLFKTEEWRHSWARTTRLVPHSFNADGERITKPNGPLPEGGWIEWVEEATPEIPWGKRPLSNPRYALGHLIGRRWKGWIDVYVADEVHDYKGRSTAIGAAFGAMVSAASYTVGLTGTLFGGYASNLYNLFLRVGNVPVMQEYGWDDERRFVEENGIVMEIAKEVERIDGAGHFSGEVKRHTETRELPGITAQLGATVQNQSVQVLLKHMGFNLVDYREEAIMLDMPSDIEANYEAIAGYWGAELAKVKDKNPSAFQAVLSRMLQSTLSYPYQPWNEKYNDLPSEIAPPIIPVDRELPHHAELAEFCSERVRDGRRVLIYVQHTGDDDIMEDVAAKVATIAARDHGTELKIKVLRSTTVKPGDRASWFKMQELDGVNVVICNPALVKTGLNLIGWPSIVVLEPVYSLYTLAQAVRRAYRPTQTKACEVVYMAYAGTMSEKAMGLVAEKMAALALLSGDEVTDGFASIGQGSSLMSQLSKMVTNAEGDSVNKDIKAMLAQSAQAVSANMQVGASEFMGVDTTLVAAIERDEPATLVLPEITLDMPEAKPEPVTVAPQAQPQAKPAPAQAKPQQPQQQQPSKSGLAFGDPAAMAAAKGKRGRRTTLKSVSGAGQQSLLDMLGNDGSAKRTKEESTATPPPAASNQTSLWGD